MGLAWAVPGLGPGQAGSGQDQAWASSRRSTARPWRHLVVYVLQAAGGKPRGAKQEAEATGAALAATNTSLAAAAAAPDVEEGDGAGTADYIFSVTNAVVMTYFALEILANVPKVAVLLQLVRRRRLLRAEAERRQGEDCLERGDGVLLGGDSVEEVAFVLCEIVIQSSYLEF
mgnify:CR=1 FL=1